MKGVGGIFFLSFLFPSLGVLDTYCWLVLGYIFLFFFFLDVHLHF
jgi:hypothetical protein